MVVDIGLNPICRAICFHNLLVFDCLTMGVAIAAPFFCLVSSAGCASSSPGFPTSKITILYDNTKGFYHFNKNLLKC